MYFGGRTWKEGCHYRQGRQLEGGLAIRTWELPWGQNACLQIGQQVNSTGCQAPRAYLPSSSPSGLILFCCCFEDSKLPSGLTT